MSNNQNDSHETIDLKLIKDRLHAINHELALTAMRQLGLEKEKDTLTQLLNPPQVITRVLGWVKVGQSVPCWRCKRATEWRNPNAAPEHKNGNCPYQESESTKLIRGLLNGDVDVDKLLGEQTGK